MKDPSLHIAQRAPKLPRLKSHPLMLLSLYSSGMLVLPAQVAAYGQLNTSSLVLEGRQNVGATGSCARVVLGRVH